VSTAAAFHIDEESDAKSLAWVYTNTPRVLVRDRSTVHNGAATLRVSMAPELRLEGEYWTNRKTTGEMVFHREAATLADSFISPDRKPD
jgi:hypothetical protein